MPSNEVVPVTFAQFERQLYKEFLNEQNDMIKRLISERDDLFKENQWLHKRVVKLKNNNH